MTTTYRRTAGSAARLGAMCIVVLAGALAPVAFSAAAADEFIKDGRPCLSGICVGDGVALLAAIEWDEAATVAGTPLNASKGSPQVVKQLTARFAPGSRDAVEAAAPYLIGLKFDGGAIDKLAKVQGFCDPMLRPMEGRFKTEEGVATKVLLDVEPAADGLTQALRVTSISRTFPQEYSAVQLKELEQQLHSRYGAVKAAATGADLKAPTWKFNLSTRELTLLAKATPSMQEASLLRRFPGCEQVPTVR